MLQMITPASVTAQPLTPQPASVNIRVAESTTEPQAIVMSVRGKCEYSEDGVTFTQLENFSSSTQVLPNANSSDIKNNWDHVVKEGAILRTSADSRITLFFRRIGITARLQEETEIKLEKMTRDTPKNGAPVMHTLLDLRKGRIFTVVRSFVAGSTLEIRNAAGRSIVEGGGEKGRYIITADGTHVTDKNSDIPLKVIGETGVTIITPGQQFLPKEGKLFPLDPPLAVKAIIEFDELQALGEEWEQSQRNKEAKLKK